MTKAAIAPALAEIVEELEPEQLALLPMAGAVEGRRHEAIREIARRGAGRPKGAKNLATRQMLDWVRKTYGDPVERRARWLLHTPESLALVLGCTKLEAFDRLDKIAAELSRLFYAQLAPVDGQGHAVAPFFAMAFGGRVQGADGRAPWDYMRSPQVIENAPQSETPETPSHGEPSHGEGKPL